MKITSVINYKGGVGKTSVTANLAAELAHRGCKILMLDMDPQASLTFSFFHPEEWEKKYAEDKTIKVWFDSLLKQKQIPLSHVVITPYRVNQHLQSSKNGGRLDLISSHLGLLNVDLDMATELGGATLKQIKTNYVKIHRRLAEGLKEFHDQDYDLILVDCPPNFNICTKNALVASDSILIPARPDYLSTLGIHYLHNSVDMLVKEYNEFAAVDQDYELDAINPQVIGVVFTMIEARSDLPISALAPFIKRTGELGLPIFEQKLRENKTMYADAPENGIPVVLRNAINPSQKTVVDELQKFAVEFAKKMGIELK